jgi:hypothetical protein
MVVVTRKYNLDRIGQRYESIDIQSDDLPACEAIAQIDECWRLYRAKIQSGKVD